MIRPLAFDDPWPDAPEGVELRYADGTSVPLDVSYLGPDDDSRLHVWGATLMVPEDVVLSGEATIWVAVMPPQTTIRIEMVG